MIFNQLLAERKGRTRVGLADGYYVCRSANKVPKCDCGNGVGVSNDAPRAARAGVDVGFANGEPIILGNRRATERFALLAEDEVGCACAYPHREAYCYFVSAV